MGKTEPMVLTGRTAWTALPALPALPALTVKRGTEETQGRHQALFLR